MPSIFISITISVTYILCDFFFIVKIQSCVAFLCSQILFSGDSAACVKNRKKRVNTELANGININEIRSLQT